MRTHTKNTYYTYTYYAVCWANGQISHRLLADTEQEATAEFAAAARRGYPRQWIDEADTDIDDDLDIACSEMTVQQWERYFRWKGAECVGGGEHGDAWMIWRI